CQRMLQGVMAEVTVGGDYDLSPHTTLPTGCGGCFANRGMGTQNQFGLVAFSRKERGRSILQGDPEPRLTCGSPHDSISGHLSMRPQQHLQKIYNGKKAALKERYWIPDSDGTYDLERIRLSRPSHIFEVGGLEGEWRERGYAEQEMDETTARRGTLFWVSKISYFLCPDEAAISAASAAPTSAAHQTHTKSFTDCSASSTAQANSATLVSHFLKLRILAKPAFLEDKKAPTKSLNCSALKKETRYMYVYLTL
ncbi:hypothetical protein Tco_0392343, partial [Tanacetum coccineum]